ncbi:MAG: 2-C-methyl-D-erythritol 4-phosphate cytidylyltransferase [Planctomycetota bacterium]|jgi:2-C-methyl-D-erythritol 4-phosphate cytidylyltransferase
MDGLLVVAAGESRRFGGTLSKVLLPLHGVPILVRAVRPFRVVADPLRVVVAARPADVAAVQQLLPRATVVAGGASRAESVRRGVDAMPEDVSVVFVHDAARPLVSVEVIRRVLTAARRDGAAVPVLRVTDALHRFERALPGRPARVTESVDRTGVVAAQTPQAARADLLRRALEEAAARGVAHPDETGALLAAGIPVTAVQGHPHNVKITVPEDLQLAERLLADE